MKPPRLHDLNYCCIIFLDVFLYIKYFLFQKFHVFFQTLEDDFAFQLEEQERHYGPYLNSALSAEAAAAEGRNSATPTDGRRGSQPSRKASSKSSGSERSAGSGSRKSSVNETSKFHHHRHSGGYMHSGQRRLSASRHSLASRGSDL